MDRPTFLIFSFLGLLLMATLHLGEIWFSQESSNIAHLIIEWLPIYTVWAMLLIIGLVKRVSTIQPQ
ncbi:hypothetical protein [Photobacterium sanguinicancri]|uniref:DUF3955 domain-containing protein n=1 Tax=Photobacterium sanguinicancri TaxID=875932 RepID=A0ABX4FYF4_9GAMM|nr:hypothetical protein [Photobacterium sanguinicancri]MDO6497585.1 hypothetical protein [Photobacterium sanguinicancri]OZS43771.1 hypothetical protein ASV53_11435 [Photobacterium sanguinicancri]